MVVLGDRVRKRENLAQSSNFYDSEYSLGLKEIFGVSNGIF